MSNSTSIEKRAAAGAVAGIASFGVTLLQAIFQVPLLLTFWSAETFGLWIAVIAATGLLTAADVGHQSFLGNEFNRLWIEDPEKLRSVLASSFRGAVIIVVAELLLLAGVIVSGRIDWLLPGVSGVSMGWEFCAAMAAYMVFWAVNGSAGGILVRLYPPAGLYARAQWFGVVYRLLGFVAVLATVAAGASLFGAMVAQITAYSLTNLVLLWDLRRQVPVKYPWWKGGDWQTAWRNLRTSLVLTCNGVLDQLISNGLTLVLAKAATPVGVAVFNTLRTVANTATQGTVVLLQPVVPDVVRYFVKREPDKLATVFAVSWMVGNSFVCAGFLLGLPFVEWFYLLWTRHRLPFDRALFAALVFAVAARQWAAPAQTLLVGLNALRAQTTLVVLRVVATLGVTFLFLNPLGVKAGGLGLLVGEVCGAIGAVVMIRQVLRGVSGFLPHRALVGAVAQLAILAGGLALFAVSVERELVWGCLAAVGVAVLGLWQWFGLPAEVRFRLRSTLPLFNRFGASHSSS